MSDVPGIQELLEGSPAGVFDLTAQRSGAALGGPVAILLFDHLDLVDFCLTYVHPGSMALSKQLPLNVEEGLLKKVAQGHEVLHAPAPEWQIQPIQAPHLSAAPLKIRDEAIGALFFGSEGAPTERQLDDLRRLGVKCGVAISVADKYTDMVERRRRRTTPSIAAELQSDQLPPRALYTPEAQVVGGIEPVYDVGGDWFDYALDHDRLFLAVCDGVGRGLTAASVSYVTLGAIRNSRKRGHGLGEMAEFAHRSLISSTNYEQFATLMLASIDLVTLQMELISAAHPDPIVIPPSGFGPPHVLSPTHSYPPLGAFEENAEYVTCRFDLEPGSRLVFFSDGATERRDPEGRQLGVEGLLEYVESSRGLVKMDALRFLMRKVGEFSERGIEDDVTIVCVDLPPFR